MSEDIRFVHRQETFNDHAIDELAKQRAACLCKIQFKRCSMSECRRCQVKQRLDNCLNAMNDYDRSRLQSYVTGYYCNYSANPMAWMSHKEYKRHWHLFILKVFGFFGIVLLALVMMCVFMGCHPQAQKPGYEETPRDQLSIDPHYYDDMIIDVIKYTKKMTRDINRDGIINCTDAAITYKLEWDKRYPHLRNKIQIARNYNINTGMNHLFVYMWVENRQRLDIEPRAIEPRLFTMKQNWGSKYDPKFNYYGETDYWIGTAR